MESKDRVHPIAFKDAGIADGLSAARGLFRGLEDKQDVRIKRGIFAGRGARAALPRAAMHRDAAPNAGAPASGLAGDQTRKC